MAAMIELNKVLIFSRLSAEALAEVEGELEPRQLADKETLFTQGDPGDELFVVQEGRVAIFVPNPEQAGQERPIRIFEAGQVLGEMSLIDQLPRSASARAMGPTQVLVLTGDNFRRLLRDYPDLAVAVMGGLSDRIRYTTDFLSEVQAWVKRVAEGKYDQSFKPGADYEDSSITALAGEFAQMAAQVKKREEELRQQVRQLRIEIDEAKKAQQVGEIVESEYFQSLKTQVAELRRKKGHS